jgi:hypothetical protein
VPLARVGACLDLPSCVVVHASFLPLCC